MSWLLASAISVIIYIAFLYKTYKPYRFYKTYFPSSEFCRAAARAALGDESVGSGVLVVPVALSPARRPQDSSMSRSSSRTGEGIGRFDVVLAYDGKCLGQEGAGSVAGF
jgi:hypothetical protein